MSDLVETIDEVFALAREGKIKIVDEQVPFIAGNDFKFKVRVPVSLPYVVLHSSNNWEKIDDD